MQPNRTLKITAAMACIAAATPAATNAELMQLRFTAGLNKPVNPIVIDGVPGEASISIAGVVTWDSDEPAFSDNGAGFRRWSIASFQAKGGGSIILENGEIIPVSLVISNTASDSFSNAILTSHYPSVMASDATWSSTGTAYTSCAESAASFSFRNSALTSMPLATSPLPDTAEGYAEGVTYWQCSMYFDVERPGGGSDQVFISANVFDIIAPGPVTMSIENAAGLPPVAQLPAPTPDLNNDGIIDTADLGILLGGFGTTVGCN